MLKRLRALGRYRILLALSLKATFSGNFCVGVNLTDHLIGLPQHAVHILNVLRVFGVLAGKADGGLDLGDVRLKLAELVVDLTERDGLLFY